MSDMLPIDRLMRRKESLRMPQERFSQKGWPPFRPQPRRTGFTVNVIRNFRAIEDGVDAAVPVDAKSASTSDLENCTNRSFPQRPHRSPFLQEEQEQRRTLQVCQSDCLNRGVHPTSVCQLACQRPGSHSNNQRRAAKMRGKHGDPGGD